MKKLTSILLCLVMIATMFAVASCGETSTPTDDTSAAPAGDTSAAPAGDTSAASAGDTSAADTEPAEDAPYVYTPDPNNQYTGGVGVGAWSTAVSYDDIKVTNNADKEVLFQTGFDEGLDGWQYACYGGYSNWDATKTDDWAIIDDGDNKVLNFGKTDANGATMWYGQSDWGNYSLAVKGKALEGIEGIRVYFAVKDENNFYVFNVGGWNNTVATVQCVVDGVETTTDKIPMTLAYGQWYTVTVNVKADRIVGFIDGEQIFQIGGDPVTDGFAGMCGMGHWSTAANLDNVKVTDFYTGEVLYENTFETEDSINDMKHDLATYSGGGYTGDAGVFTWEDGYMVNTNSATTGVLSYFGDASWTNYIFSYDVMPTAGIEGATILGAINPDVPSYVLYNCGGWNNTKGCWQTYDAGTTNSYDSDSIAFTMEYDTWNTLTLVVLNYAIFSYINGTFYQAWWY